MAQLLFQNFGMGETGSMPGNSTNKTSKHNGTTVLSIEDGVDENDETSPLVLRLADLVPGSTPQERHRFLTARGGNLDRALQMLKNHLEFRVQHLDNKCLFDPWDENELCQSIEELNCRELSRPIPQIVHLNTGEPYAKDKTRLCQMLPAMLDPSLASAEDYALRIAQYLDRRISRTSTEKVTVLIDARGGYGWANPSALRLMPYVKRIIGTLQDHFPERLSQCVVFPVPRSAMAIWKLVKAFVDPDTVGKIVLLSGVGMKHNDFPPRSILGYVEQRALDILENRRRSLFVRKEC